MAATLPIDPGREVFALLGAERFLADEPTLDGLLTVLRAGLPFTAVEAVAAGSTIPTQDLTGALGIAPRTLARRKVARQLSADESDRLYRLARVIAQAKSVLGTAEKARDWLTRPHRGLGGAVPLQLLDTDLGAREVEEVLQRINHGIFG